MIAALRVLVDEATTPMAVIDLDGRFLYANRALAGLFGERMSPDDLLDVDFATLAVDPAELRSVFARAATEGWRGPLRLCRSDLAPRELLLKLSPVCQDMGGGDVAALAAELTFAPVARPLVQADAQPDDNEAPVPILPIAPRVIVVPLAGELGPKKATLLMRFVLAGIGRHRAKAVIVDVTALRDMELRSADYLAKVVMAARLKGAKTIVSGVSEQTAETLAEINVEWKGVTTVGQLQTGLALALEHIGVTLESSRPRDTTRGR